MLLCFCCWPFQWGWHRSHCGIIAGTQKQSKAIIQTRIASLATVLEALSHHRCSDNAGYKVAVLVTWGSFATVRKELITIWWRSNWLLCVANWIAKKTENQGHFQYKGSVVPVAGKKRCTSNKGPFWNSRARVRNVLGEIIAKFTGKYILKLSSTGVLFPIIVGLHPNFSPTMDSLFFFSMQELDQGLMSMWCNYFS